MRIYVPSLVASPLTKHVHNCCTVGSHHRRMYKTDGETVLHAHIPPEGELAEAVLIPKLIHELTDSARACPAFPHEGPPRIGRQNLPKPRR